RMSEEKERDMKIIVRRAEMSPEILLLMRMNKDFFPILELPPELSAKILSNLGEKELGVCLRSLALDKMLYMKSANSERFPSMWEMIAMSLI
ncbi:hypothetical protein PFISCL1PPCAC_21872, partial [Pristionchus fissidentatus]